MEHFDVIGRLISLIHEMTPEERRMLLEQLEQNRLSYEACLEERAHERRECTIAVDYADIDRAFTDYIRDISPSGVFMLSRRKFQLGEEIYLRISFPEEQNPFKIPAEVVRTTLEGVGLKFKFKSQVQQVIIASLIKNLKTPRKEKQKRKAAAD